MHPKIFTAESLPNCVSVCVCMFVYGICFELCLAVTADFFKPVLSAYLLYIIIICSFSVPSIHSNLPSPLTLLCTSGVLINCKQMQLLLPRRFQNAMVLICFEILQKKQLLFKYASPASFSSKLILINAILDKL